MALSRFRPVSALKCPKSLPSGSRVRVRVGLQSVMGEVARDYRRTRNQQLEQRPSILPLPLDGPAFGSSRRRRGRISGGGRKFDGHDGFFQLF